MRTLFILFIFSFATITLQAQAFNYQNDYKKLLAQSKDKNDALHYPKLLKRFLQNDTTLKNYDMLALMIGYTGTKKYKPYAYLGTEDKIYNFNATGKYKQALVVCDTFLKRHPLSVQGLAEKSYAFHKTGQPDSAAVYSRRLQRILIAMSWSGDGLTSETAVFSIGPADGQTFIARYKHGKIGAMTMDKDKQGHVCDVLEATYTEEGKEKTEKFYFIIDHAYKTLKR